MESGLDGRNNLKARLVIRWGESRLNGVRPRWPEQFELPRLLISLSPYVSMESGLDGRNNPTEGLAQDPGADGLSQWSPA